MKVRASALLLAALLASAVSASSEEFTFGPCRNAPQCMCKWSEGKKTADCSNADLDVSEVFKKNRGIAGMYFALFIGVSTYLGKSTVQFLNEISKIIHLSR